MMSFVSKRIFFCYLYLLWLMVPTPRSYKCSHFTPTYTLNFIAKISLFHKNYIAQLDFDFAGCPLRLFGQTLALNSSPQIVLIKQFTLVLSQVISSGRNAEDEIKANLVDKFIYTDIVQYKGKMLLSLHKLYIILHDMYITFLR